MRFMWIMFMSLGLLMYWPKRYEQMNHQLGNVYAFGCIDAHAASEQVMLTMEFVDLHECSEFYKQEDPDSQWKCVFESGMTLAVPHLRRWKLLGVSVLGPGCALPARIIDFARYVPWVQQETADQHRDPHVSKSLRHGMQHIRSGTRDRM